MSKVFVFLFFFLDDFFHVWRLCNSCGFCQQINTKLCVLVNQIIGNVFDSALIGTFLGYTPTLCRSIVSYGDVSDPIFTEQCLDFLQDRWPVFLGQGAKNVVANDYVVFLSRRNTIRTKVRVIPITGKVTVVDLMALTTAKIKRSDVRMIQDIAMLH